MPEDIKNVQPDVVPEETPSTEVVTPQPQPLSPEIEAKIQETIAKATKEATEVARREIQSAKDKARAEVEGAQRRAQIAEDTLRGIHGGLAQTDPEQAELITLKAEKQARQRADFESSQRQQMDAFDQGFYGNISQSISAMGIDPTDPRIDWAQDATVTGNYFAKQQRILTSVAKIQKESTIALEAKLRQEMKDTEARISKKLGIDSVDTSTSPGVGGSDTDFINQMADGKVPMTKENVARFKKLTT